MVSDQIHSYGSWERDTVMKVMKVMEIYEDAVFIGNDYNELLEYVLKLVNCVFILFIRRGL